MEFEMTMAGHAPNPAVRNPQQSERRLAVACPSGRTWQAVPRLLALLLATSLFWGCSDDTGGAEASGSDAGWDTAGPPREDAGAGADAQADATPMDADTVEPLDSGNLDIALPETDADASAAEGDAATDAAVDAGPVELRIAGLDPSRGPVEGGTGFALRGTGLSAQSVVYFGSQQARATFVEGVVVGEVPAGTGPGPVNVKVLDPTLGQATLVDGYTYTTRLELVSVSPVRLPVDGNVEVSVYGHGFTSGTRVSFGGTTGLRHTLVDATHLRVLAPPHGAGSVEVRATTPDATASLEGAVTYYETVRIDRVRAASGPTQGGQSVTVSGAGFANGMTVEFGGRRANVATVSASGAEATVMTPAHPEGIVDLRIETAQGDAALLQGAYYYGARPDSFALGAVAPGQGPSSGGTDVALTGAGLSAPGLTVSFGDQAAAVIDRGPGHAIVRIPAHAPGVVDVVISDGVGQSSRLAQSFRYVRDLWIDGLTPPQGDTGGQNLVEIRGEGFTGATRVRFGAIAASLRVLSDTRLEATAPAQAAGTVDVSVEREGLVATLRQGYRYTEALEVQGMQPVRGSIAGNTYVLLRGQGFAAPVQVRFGTELAPLVEVLDAQTLAVRTPAHPSGDVAVEVVSGGQQAAAPGRYTYFNPGSRFGGAWGGPVQGAVNVTVYSSGGAPLEGAFVMLSTNARTPYQGVTNADGLVTLSGPHVYGDQTVTAVAAEHSSATVQRVNAENITIFLNPPPSDGPPPPGPPTAQFQGNVNGLDKVAEPGPGEYRMAIVYATKRDPWAREPEPGDGNVLFANGPYTINTRIGDLALVAVGGLYNNTTQKFRPLAMGVARYLFAAEGGSYTVNLELNIRLDQVLTFKFGNAPRGANGPTYNEATPYLDFGVEGVFGGIDVATGPGDIIQALHQAPLTGVLADAAYLVVGGAYSTDGNAPLSEGFKRNVTDVDNPIIMPMLPTVPFIYTPRSGERLVNGLVEFTRDASALPNLYYVQVQTFMGQTVWDGFLPGNATSFRFPDFPSFAHLPPEQRPVPYPGGSYVLLMIGISKPGLTYENFSYSDLSFDVWDAYSFTYQIIQF